MDQNYNTRSLTINIKMDPTKPTQKVAVGGYLTCYLVKNSEDIKSHIYPADRPMGSNGKPTFVDVRFTNVQLQNDYKIHQVIATVTYKGANDGAMRKIMDQSLEVLLHRTKHFLEGFQGFQQTYTRNSMFLKGANLVDIIDVTDTIALTQAIANWDCPEWQEKRMIRLACRSIIMAVFGRLMQSEKTEQSWPSLDSVSAKAKTFKPFKGRFKGSMSVKL